MKGIATLFIGIVLVSYGCRTSKSIQTTIEKTDTVAITPVFQPNHSKTDSIAFIKELYNKVLDNEISFTTFSGKIDLDYEDGDGKKYDVTAHVRLHKDSVIWLSVTAILGIEGMRVYITPDSVKLLNKQDKIYTAKSISYLQELTALPLDLSTLQDLLIGNSVFLDSNIISYSRSEASISMVTKGLYFKNLFTVDTLGKEIQSSKLEAFDLEDKRNCFLTYTDYENKKGVNFSTKRKIDILDKKQLKLKLDFKQYEFNEKLSFPFSVPKSYSKSQ